MSSYLNLARISGLIYLAVAITGYFAYYATESPLVAGDIKASAENILHSISLYRTGIFSHLLMSVFWIFLAIAFYRMFVGTNKTQALLILCLVLVGSAVSFVNALLQFGAQWTLSASGYTVIFNESQRQAQLILLLDLSRHGVYVAYIFFGLWLLPLSYLIYKSATMPHIIAILVAIAGLGYIADFLIYILMIGQEMRIVDYTFWGELFLLLWLLIKGTRELPSFEGVE